MKRFFHFAKAGWPLLLLWLVTTNLQAQRCGVTQYLEALMNEDSSYIQTFENLDDDIAQILQNVQMVSGVIIVPVVFHVIHNGDPYGVNENLSDDLIIEQVRQLNADFRRTNADAANTPAAFLGVAADANIEFCLARRTPDGYASTGIDRVNISTLLVVSESDCWEPSYIDNYIKKRTTWDADKYLNIWTLARIDDTNDDGCAPLPGLVGYATFPGGKKNVDGIAIVASSVGSVNKPNPVPGPYNLGRTATHEIGHWLNLRHIWGDDNGCSGSDKVSDTPNQGKENRDCPTFPSISCGNGPNGDMFMNYMDYVDDNCVNLFTAGQARRMNDAINAKRRALLSAECFECPSWVYLSYDNPGRLYGPINFASSENLVAVNTVDKNAVVEYRAASSIVLDPNFEAEFGSEFLALIGDCPSPLPKPLPLVGNQNKVERASFLDLEAPEMIVFPNPITETATVQVSLPSESKVSLEVLDMMGQRLGVLANETRLGEGIHSFVVHQEGLHSGVYFVRFSVDGKFMATKKIVFL